MPQRPRNYPREYAQYQGKPEQKKRRAERNAARRQAEKRGAVSKGDGKEVDHINAPRKGSLSNVPTRVIPKRANRRMQPKRK